MLLTRRWASVSRIIVGLGNPGLDGTRHNIGFAVVDRIAQRSGVAFGGVREGASVARMGDTLLVKPMLFMNLSGHAVAPLVRFYKVPLERLLVVYDEADLEPGEHTHTMLHQFCSLGGCHRCSSFFAKGP